MPNFDTFKLKIQRLLQGFFLTVYRYSTGLILSFKIWKYSTVPYRAKSLYCTGTVPCCTLVSNHFSVRNLQRISSPSFFFFFLLFFLFSFFFPSFFLFVFANKVKSEKYLNKWNVTTRKRPKTQKSPDLLYNFFRPRLRRGQKKFFLNFFEPSVSHRGQPPPTLHRWKV